MIQLLSIAFVVVPALVFFGILGVAISSDPRTKSGNERAKR
jgi:hypothetical protein